METNEKWKAYAELERAEAEKLDAAAEEVMELFRRRGFTVQQCEKTLAKLRYKVQEISARARV